MDSRTLTSNLAPSPGEQNSLNYPKVCLAYGKLRTSQTIEKSKDWITRADGLASGKPQSVYVCVAAVSPAKYFVQIGSTQRSDLSFIGSFAQPCTRIRPLGVNGTLEGGNA